MTKKLKYVILENESLIIEYYCGKFYVNDLIDFKKRIGKDKKFKPTYNVISDIRELEFLFKMPEVKQYVDFLVTNQKQVGIRKTTMITDTPNQVITSLSFDILKGTLPINFKVYSSLESAYAFLGLSLSDGELVDSHLIKLKNAQ